MVVPGYRAIISHICHIEDLNQNVLSIRMIQKNIDVEISLSWATHIKGSKVKKRSLPD